MKKRNMLGLLGVCALSAIAADALAMPAAVMPIGKGNEGRLDGDMRLRGPGFEQTTLVNLSRDGKQYIVLITMQSIDEQGLAPWQCSCSSLELSPNGPPKVVADLKRLTNYGNGERVCNHPKAATDGQNIVWMYGSDVNSNRPKTYAGAINHMCEQIVAPVLVSEDPNSNEGAPDVVFNAADAASGASYFTGGYLSQGGTKDQTFALGLKLTKSGVLYNLEKTYLQSTVTPANIGRPAMESGGANRTLICASKGNNRPAEQGVECDWINSMTGEVLWKNVVVQADRDNHKFMGQPSLTKLADGRYALNVIESNGAGKNTNLKGSNLAHLYALDVAADAVVVGGEISGAAAYQTHAAVCSGAYGESGNRVVGVISASPTGIGRPAMLMVNYDGNAKQFAFDDTNDKWPVAWYGDSGHLANWYGRNPGRQGRDFLRCIGDVPNPGHGVEGGYMSQAETFFVAAVAGRVPGDAKNSLTLSLVPGKVDKATPPENPQPATDVTSAPPSTDNTPAPSTDASASSGCACSTPGGTSKSDLGGLALLGLAIGAVVTRKRRA